MSGWTVVDSVSNKSLPIQGTSGSGVGVPYIAPSPASQDPVGKMRVSTPQSLIDTDFEYGTQPTKWESIGLQNNRQSLYYIPQQPREITTVTGNGTRTVVINMANTSGFVVGSPIYVQNSSDSNANGWYYVEAVTPSTNITYTASANVAAGNQYNATLTYVYLGYFYSGCGIQIGAGAFSTNTSTTTVTTSTQHGLSAGSLVYVTGVTATATGGGTGSINNGAGGAGTALTLTVSPSAGPSAVRTGMTVAGAGVTTTTITATTQSLFNATFDGTTSAMTYVSGTIPTIGMQLTGVGIAANTYIVSGTSPNFVVSTIPTAGVGVAVTGYAWTVATSQGPVGPVALTFTSTLVSSAPNGAWVVATVPTPNTFTYATVNNLGSGSTMSNAAGTTVLFARPSGYVEPRTFDGGVAFSSGAAVPDQQLIRQTRRYFRYQSGKGIQFSTGSSLQPPLFTTSIVSSSGTVTVTCRYAHNLTVGSTIQVTGVNQGGFNGIYNVATVTSPTVFTYVAPNSGSQTATGPVVKVTPTIWYGSNSRIGFFDQQNGMFFEYDGKTLYTVWRNSVQQINGTVTVTQGSTNVTGSGTAFTSQLFPGQFIVIRGQSYRIINITSDTALNISPEYRGVSIAGAVVSMTVDVKTPQSRWIDPCNGTGPSGYTLDLTRMQMWYIDYSWYGAGFIRWGLRASNGQIVYVNQQTNNNARFEAYLRSGNMPAHYEISGLGPTTYPVQGLSASGSTISANVTSLQTTIPVASTAAFNAGGGVASLGNEYIYYGSLSTVTGAGNLVDCVRGFGNTAADDQTSGTSIAPSSIQVADAAGFYVPPAGSTGSIKVSNATSVEYITYRGITNTGIIYGLSRSQTGGNAAPQTFAAGTVTAITFASPDTVPSLSHWGSSAIMDGLFNDDKSLIFNYGMNTPLTVTGSVNPIVIMALRIAPSVDNGTTSTLGNKEIINRMQLQLDSLGLYTTGTGFLINLVLNGFASGAFSGAFQTPIQQLNGITSSLSQIALNTNAITVTGGESVAAAYTATSGPTTLDLGGVRDLGNSILGGGTTLSVPTGQAGFYPDGPDILYVVATPLTTTTSSIVARLSWKEAQA